MGITRVEGTVNALGGRGSGVGFLEDSGAPYSLRPQDVWQSLELAPRRRLAFTLADGATIERDVSERHITLPQGEAHTPVILGEAGDEALLGVVTLEILGSLLNPFNRTLQPMRMLLA